MRIECTCIVCGAKFYERPYRAAARKYCSFKCLGVDRTGRWHSPKSERTLSRGYVYLYRPDHPNATGRGLVAEHRIVAEQTLGRLLTASEVVHHINGDHSDNRPDNLSVMTQSEHARLHWTGNQIGKIDGWSKLHAACVECGTTTTRHAARGMCDRCYRHRRYLRTGS